MGKDIWTLLQSAVSGSGQPAVVTYAKVFAPFCTHAERSMLSAVRTVPHAPHVLICTQATDPEEALIEANASIFCQKPFSLAVTRPGSPERLLLQLR